jgi:hypothetical protein
MSAYLCSEYHVNVIVNAIDSNPDDFKTLVAANLRSLSARYPGRGFLQDWIDESKMLEYRPMRALQSWTQIVKACDCFDYQACESDDYKESQACAFVARVRAQAIACGGKTSGAEYNAAKWSL